MQNLDTAIDDAMATMGITILVMRLYEYAKPMTANIGGIKKYIMQIFYL
jgi:hypothetical protein